MSVRTTARCEEPQVTTDGSEKACVTNVSGGGERGWGSLLLIDLGGEGIPDKLLEESAQIKLFAKCMGLKFEEMQCSCPSLHCRLCSSKHADLCISFMFTNVHPDNRGKKFTVTLDAEDENSPWTCESLSFQIVAPFWLLWKGNDWERPLLFRS